MINVAIVEDDAELRGMLLEFLKETGDLIPVASFGRAEDYLKSYRSYTIDVVLMDISLPGMSGIQAVTQVKHLRPGIQYLMCTTHNDATRTFDSLCAGATGYILKTSSPDQIFNAIREIHAGGSPMSTEIARMVVASFPNKKQNMDLLQRITNREQEILHALAKGYSYKEIAAQLFISVETVRTFLRNIYEKLQVHSKVEALNKVFPKGFHE